MRAVLSPAAAFFVGYFAAVAVALAAPADPGGTVTFAWGDLIAGNADWIASGLVAIVLWMIRRLPGEIQAVIRTARVEQLLERAITYGVNSVVGAAAGRSLSVSVSQPVLASALQYALDRMPSALLKWVGGPPRLAEMIWARLDVATEAGRPDLDQLAGRIMAGQPA